MSGKSFAAVVALLVPAVALCSASAFREDASSYWSFERLKSVPKFRDCPYQHSEYPGLRPILVKGYGPKRSSAEFFCYYAVPDGQMPDGGFPAVLLVHGGGGTAFPKWVDIWRKKGFAVLAPDWYNQRPTPGTLGRADLPGGKRAYGQFSEGVKVYIQPQVNITLQGGKQQITITWDKADGCTGYQIFYTEAGTGGVYAWWKNVPAGTLSATLTGLKANTDYWFKVRSYVDLPDGRYYGQLSEAKHVMTLK